MKTPLKAQLNPMMSVLPTFWLSRPELRRFLTLPQDKVSVASLDISMPVESIESECLMISDCCPHLCVASFVALISERLPDVDRLQESSNDEE